MKQNLHLGVLYALAGAAAFASMGAMIKFASVDLPTPVVVFLRNGFALVLLVPILLRSGAPDLRTHRPLMHLTRALTGLTAMYCFFYAIPRLHLADAVLLHYSQPLFIPFIAWVWLSERPPGRIFPAVAIGFVGVALILKPSPAMVSTAGLIALASGMLAATAMTSIRKLSSTEPTTRIVFYFTIFGTLITAGPAIWFWQSPSPADLTAMIAAGVFAVCGQLSLTRAYSLAPAAHVGSLVYTAVIFAAIWGWAVWSEVPDIYSAGGAALVIVAAVIVVFARRSKSQTAAITTKPNSE